jgi:hypothetical protein
VSSPPRFAAGAPPPRLGPDSATPPRRHWRNRHRLRRRRHSHRHLHRWRALCHLLHQMPVRWGSSRPRRAETRRDAPRRAGMGAGRTATGVAAVGLPRRSDTRRSGGGSPSPPLTDRRSPPLVGGVDVTRRGGKPIAASGGPPGASRGRRRSPLALPPVAARRRRPPPPTARPRPAPARASTLAEPSSGGSRVYSRGIRRPGPPPGRPSPRVPAPPTAHGRAPGATH